MRHAQSASGPSRRRGRLPPQPPDRLLPPAAGDPAFHLVLPLDGPDRHHRRPQLADLDLHGQAAARPAPADVQLRPLPGAPRRIHLARRQSLPGLHGRGRRIPDRRAAPGRARRAAALDDPPPYLPRHPGADRLGRSRRIDRRQRLGRRQHRAQVAGIQRRRRAHLRLRGTGLVRLARARADAEGAARRRRLRDRLHGAGDRVRPPRHGSLPERRPDGDARRRHRSAATPSGTRGRGPVRPSPLAADGLLPDPAHDSAPDLAPALVDPRDPGGDRAVVRHAR